MIDFDRPDVQYYFGYSFGPTDRPSLEAVKTWIDGDTAERRFDTLTVGEYDTFDEAVPDERVLEGLLRDQGVQPAMNAAERMATERGFLDPHRADARIFFRDDAPEDPFTTERQRERDTPAYVVNAISADGDPFLDVLKLWGDDYARLVVPQPDWDSARDTALAAGDLLNAGHLQDALRLVEVAAVDSGVIAPDRADPRLFTEGPPDPFITIRQEQLVRETIITMSSDYDTEEIPVEPPVTFTPSRSLADADIAREGRDALHGAAWFEATFAHSETELLPPIDDTVNYALQLQSYQPYSVDLTVDKYWREPDGALGWESVHMETYEVWRREEAQQDYDRLRDLYDARGLEALMHQAELTAMKHGTLDSDRAELPLFSDGPPDRFESLAQQLRGEINPYWNPEADLLEIPAFVADNPYWRLQTLPVSDPDGQPLGHALQMVVYPGVEHDPEQAEPPALAADEPFRRLEFAHFRTPAEADKFVKEFEGYLVPGLLDGPELAEEVARIEGLPVTWRALDGDDLIAYRNEELTLTRGPEAWTLYNPHAERDARVATEAPEVEVRDRAATSDLVDTATPDLDR